MFTNTLLASGMFLSLRKMKKFAHSVIQCLSARAERTWKLDPTGCFLISPCVFGEVGAKRFHN